MPRKLRPAIDRLPAVVLSVMLATGAPAPAAAQDVSVGPPTLNPGDSFRFGEGDRTYLVQDVGWDGELFVSIVSYEGGRRYRDFYTAELNLVRSQEIGSPETFHFAPHSMKYRFPMHVGLRWEGRFDTEVRMPSGFVTERYATAQSCAVRCIEAVEVPAGRFETFRIDCTQRRSNAIFEEEYRYWYSPEAGVSVASETRRLDMPGLVDRVELIALERAGRQAFDALPDGVTSTCDLELVSR